MTFLGNSGAFFEIKDKSFQKCIRFFLILCISNNFLFINETYADLEKNPNDSRLSKEDTPPKNENITQAKGSSKPTSRQSFLKKRTENGGRNIGVLKSSDFAKYRRRPASEVLPKLESYTRESFFAELRAQYENSLKMVVYDRVETSVKIEKALSQAQDPWTISNAAKVTDYWVYPKYQEYLNTLTLKYENQNGFAAQAYVDYFNSSKFDEFVTSRYSHNNLGFSISQDLWSFFRKTNFELNQEATELSGKSQMISAESTNLNDILKLIDMSYQLYASICKKSDLEQVYEIGKNTLEVSEVQQSARTISMRDYLRIRSTFLSIQRQLAAAEYEIQSSQKQFLAISNETYLKAQALSKEKLKCDEDLKSLETVISPSKLEIEKWIRQHPSILGMDLAKESLKKKMEIYKANRSSKLTLTGGYDKVNNVELREPYDQKYIGVTFTYQFQGDSYKLNQQNLAEQITDISIKQQISEQEVVQYLLNMSDQIQFQKSQISLVQDSVTNADRLLKIIETQQSIGQLDATAIDSAIQSQIQAQSEKRSLGSMISANSLKLDEVKKASIKAGQWR